MCRTTRFDNTSALDTGRYATDAERWEALVRRDPGSDGVFYYAVKSTGVYCRPSCGARRALRANVAFYETRTEAEAAGFRPCKRCRPDAPARSREHKAAIAAACRRIQAEETAPSLATLAKDAGLSRFHFHRVFTRIVGLTPKRYAQAQRAERLRAELSRRGTVTEAIYGAGYNSNSRFYAHAREMLGMSPSRFRGGGQGETIRFAVGKCSLGSVLVAASSYGVCAISLGDDANQLVSDFQDRFPRAELVGNDRKFERLVSQVVGLVERPGDRCELPLDIRGTAFQQKVWQALRQIQAGTTVSYADLAKRIGMPKAVRAVGQACGANPLAVAVPCHRVRRTTGQLSGYRWGVERKRALLGREARQTG